ncbi:MAG: penicillin acylase family protein [Prochlorothrix sp.]
MSKNLGVERMRLALQQILPAKQVDDLFPPPILEHPAILSAEEWEEPGESGEWDLGKLGELEKLGKLGDQTPMANPSIADAPPIDTSDRSVVDPPAVDPPAVDPLTAELALANPVTADPVTADRIMGNRSILDAPTAEPATIEPVTAEPAIGNRGSTNRGSTNPALASRPLDRAASTVLDPLPFLTEIDRQIRTFISPQSTSLGSNSWVVSGDRTHTGLPLLADDPHLGVQLPSIWYGLGLHCTTVSTRCPYNVTGVTFPSIPVVVVCHNDRFAWGVTNVGSDVMDLYIEKLNPANPTQYKRDGEWVDLELQQVQIDVAGQDPVVLQIRSTVHGPLLSDVEPRLQAIGLTPEAVGESSPSADPSADTPMPLYALALRWTALEESHLMRSIQRLDLAQNWSEFRAALEDFDVPAQNFVYTDVDGNIGYQMPGHLPLRQGFDGRDPVPGWDSRYDWQGYRPFDQLPRLFNPDRGWIATANEPVLNPAPATPDRLPIPGDYAYGYRAQRISDRLAQQSAPFTPESLGAIQLDVLNLNAQDLIPALLPLQFEDPLAQQLQQQLARWDCQQTAESPEAALFETFWFELLALVFRDELPQPYWPDGDSDWFAVVRSLLTQPQNPWWDDVRTPATEDRDQALAQAFTTAIATVQDLLGPDPNTWRWGDLHTLTFDNTTLGRSGIVPLERLLNRGPYPAPGGPGLVNAIGWGARKETAAEALRADTLPSMRMVLNPAHWDRSLWVHAPGQSGHPFHRHYSDLVLPWLAGHWFPLPWSPDPPPSAGQTLTLLPSTPEGDPGSLGNVTD